MALTIKELQVKLGIDVNSNSFKRAKQGLASIKKTALQLTAALTGVVAGAIAVTKSVSDTVTEVSVLSRRFGIASGSLQTWLSLAKSAGVESAQFADGIKDFTIKLGQTTKGTDATAVALKKLGINYKELKKQSPEQRLQTVLKALNGVEDASTRAALAAAIAGDTGGQTFITLSKEVNKYNAEKKSLIDTGAMISPEDIDAAEKSAKVFNTLDKIVFGLKKTIASAVTPAIKDLTDKISVWVKNNQGLIKTKIHTFIGKVVDIVETLTPILLTAAENIDKIVIAWGAYKLIGVVQFVTGVIGVLWGMFAAEGAVAVNAGLMWAAITGPVGLTIIAVGLFAAAVIKYWDEIVDGAKVIWKWLKKAFNVAVVKPIIAYLKLAKSFYVGIWEILKSVGSALKGAFDVAIIAPFTWALNKIRDTISWIQRHNPFSSGGDYKITDTIGTPDDIIRKARSSARRGSNGFSGITNTVGTKPPALSQAKSPDVNTQVKVYIGDKELKGTIRTEARNVIDKTLRQSSPT